ncbi:NAD(P)-binding domain-containing protein [Naumannella halotolerans]|uniref:NAD(P)-binding domain-containing protein n=1 Tax=Naumannella halotolerans TaxID=993414 RepID=UPI00370DCF6C
MTSSHPDSIGFIGVGEIAAAMVDGLCRQQDPPMIILSPRGADISARLASAHPNVSVAADNSAVAEQSSTVVLPVRPDQVHEALSGLAFGPGTTLISAVAATSITTLTGLVGDAVTITRSIPMPAVRHGSGVTAIHPDEPVTSSFYETLGTVVPVDSEDAFSTLSVCSATVSTMLGYLAEIGAWAGENDVEPEAVDAYLKGIFAGVGEEIADPATGLDELAKGHETPGGLNEQLRTSWLTRQNRSALRTALDAVRRRTTQGLTTQGLTTQGRGAERLYTDQPWTPSDASPIRANPAPTHTRCAPSTTRTQKPSPAPPSRMSSPSSVRAAPSLP